MNKLVERRLYLLQGQCIGPLQCLRGGSWHFPRATLSEIHKHLEENTWAITELLAAKD